VIIRHIDALRRLVDEYKESRIESIGDIESFVQKAERAVNRHVYPIMSALDAMDQFVIEWYKTTMIENAVKSSATEERINEISNMKEDDVRNKLTRKIQNEKTEKFLKRKGFFEYIYGHIGDIAEEFNKTFEKWSSAFTSEQSRDAFEKKNNELMRVGGFDNEEDIDKQIRAVRRMVRLAETKIQLIESIVTRIKNGGVLVTGFFNDIYGDEIALKNIPGEETKLILWGRSLPEWTEFGKFFIGTFEIIIF
jgi:hypothetical protein